VEHARAAPIGRTEHRSGITAALHWHRTPATGALIVLFLRIATSEGGMNHDPMRFCFECKKMEPTKGFRPLSRARATPRAACAECFDKAEVIRKERHAAIFW
jgi:hypothetical protein